MRLVWAVIPLVLIVSVMGINESFANVNSTSLKPTFNPNPLEIWNYADVILDGTVIEIKTNVLDVNNNFSNYYIKVNKFFKGNLDTELLSVKKHDSLYQFEVGDNGLFYLKFNSYSQTDYMTQYSVKTFDDCNARDLIEISPTLPNDDILVRGFMGVDWEFKDQCVAHYFTYDPDFWNYRIIKSPLRQYSDHSLPINLQKCANNDHISIFPKNNLEHIACVKPTTAEKLIERGWGILSFIERCNTIDGQWNHEFQNCELRDLSHGLYCEEIGAKAVCMSHKQRSSLNDLCVTACEFEEQNNS
jgi:hypothetical protein